MPVAGATLPTASAIQTYLNGIYKGANVVFTVETKPDFAFDLGTGANAGLERSDETVFGKYSLEMRALKSAYMAFDADYNKKASYIFVVPSFTGSGTLSGFMVRGRSVGFITSSADNRTIAHELGHGVFGLEHTFPEIAVSTTNNLMDYGVGTHLTHEQWKIIHARKPAYSWFDTEEDGALANPYMNVYLYPACKLTPNDITPNNFTQAQFEEIRQLTEQIFSDNGLSDITVTVVYNKPLTIWPFNPNAIYNTLSNHAETNFRDAHVALKLGDGLPFNYVKGETNTGYIGVNNIVSTYSTVLVDTDTTKLLKESQRKYAAAFGIAHEVWHQLLTKAIYYLARSNMEIRNILGGHLVLPITKDDIELREKLLDMQLFTVIGRGDAQYGHYDTEINLNLDCFGLGMWANTSLDVNGDILGGRGYYFYRGSTSPTKKIEEAKSLKILVKQKALYWLFKSKAYKSIYKR